MNTKTATKIIFTLLTLCVISPLIHSKTSMYGMSVPKVIFFWGIVEVMQVVYVILTQISPQDAPKKSLLNISVLIYVIIVIISSIFSISQTGSFLSSFERMDGTINLIHFVAFFFIVGSIKLSDNQWRKVIIITCITALLVSIFGKYESEHFDDGRIHSTLSNPLYVAIYLIFHNFILIIVFIKTIKNDNAQIRLKSVIYIFIIIISFIFQTYVLVYTKSRSAIIAFVFGLLVSLLLLTLFQVKYRKHLLFIFSVILIGITFLYISRNDKWIESDSALYRITKLSVIDNSISARKELWKMSLDGLTEKPIIGWGKESYIYYFAKYYSPTLHDNGFWYDRSHNFILDRFIEGGLLCLISYLFFIGCIFFTLWQKKNTINLIEKCFISGYLVAYLVFNLAVFDSYVSMLILFTLMAYIQQKSDNERLLVKKIKPIFGVFLLLAMCFIYYNTVIRTFKTNMEWNAAGKSNEFTELLNRYKQVYEDAWIGKYDVGLDFALQKDRIKSSNFDGLVKAEYYNLAATMLTELLDKYPNHPILLSQLGFIQQYSGNNQKAIETYNLLREIAPKRQVNLMDLGVLYLENKEYEKAITLFDKIYKLDKTYHLSLIYKAYALALNRNKEDAKIIICNLPTESVIDNIQFVNKIFNYNNDDESLMTLLSNTPDKSKFRPNTFLIWLRIAAEKNNKSEVHSSIFSFYKHFLPESDLISINQLIEGINSEKLPPEELSKYFNEN